MVNLLLGSRICPVLGMIPVESVIRLLIDSNLTLVVQQRSCGYKALRDQWKQVNADHEFMKT